MNRPLLAATVTFYAVLISATVGQSQHSTKAKNLNDIASDLVVPAVTDDSAAAGKRVRHRHPDDSKLFHVLYLPQDWKPDRKYPVIVEYPGNGGFRNQLGDVSTGRIEDCKLGYGISGGEGIIWVCLPFVNPDTHQHELNWWGDPDATAAYCRRTVELVCRDYGGDRDSVILAGFSRGAIACSYIGLRDDETAKLWRGIIAHSHYDGVRKWDYPASDADSARRRIARFAEKPQFVSHELSVADTQRFLQNSNLKDVTFVALPYPNHSDQWVLKDLPERKQLREWLARVLK